MAEQVASSVLATGFEVVLSVGTLVNIGLNVATYWFKSNRSEIEKLRREVKAAEEARDARVHELTAKAVDAKFSDYGHQVRNIANDLKIATAEFKDAVAESKGKFKALDDRDQQTEMTLLRDIKDMQIELARNGATKADLKEHEQSVQRQMGELRAEYRKGG